MQIFREQLLRRRNLAISLVGLLLLNLFLTLPLQVQAAPQMDSFEKVTDSNFSTRDPIVLPLPDGRRIKIGGQGKRDYCNQPRYDICTPGTKDVEIFDPTNNIWTVAPPMQVGRNGGMGVVLNDGKILVTGGVVMVTDIITGQYTFTTTYEDTATSEIYDPTTNTWQTVASMKVSRYHANITLLKDGRVLLLGGNSYSQTPELTQNAEVYNPTTNQWSTLPNKPLLTGPLTLYTLDDGKVVALKMTGEMAVYDPSLDLWTGKPSAVRSDSTVYFRYVKLNNEEILALGPQNSNNSQLYNLTTETWTAYPHDLPDGTLIYMEDYSTLAIQKYVGTSPYNKRFYFYNLVTHTSSETTNLYEGYMGITLSYLGNGKIMSHGGYTEQVVGPHTLPVYTFYKNTYIYQSGPQAPAQFKASKNANSVTFTWQDRASNEDGYLVERKPSASTNWEALGRTAANATTFTDSAPLAGTQMDYRLKAFKGTNYSLPVLLSKLQIGTLPVYRFYRLSNGTHFYTMDEKEKNSLVENYPYEMKYEGVAYKGWDGYESNPNLVAVYRFYNTQTKAHFYTANPTEKDALIANWSQLYKYEGAAFYAQASTSETTQAVYRFYNYQTKAHFYTANPVEKDALIANWKQLYNYEGVAFYAS